MNTTENQVHFVKDRNGIEWTGCGFAANGILRVCHSKVVGYWKSDRFDHVAPICRAHANRLIGYAKSLDNTATNFLVEVSK